METHIKNTIFLKDSVLFISKDGNEYEVSNPEVALLKSWEGDWIKLDDRPGIVGEYVKIKPEETFEWPGGVELIELYQLNGTDGWVPFESVSQARGGTFTRKLFARLLPKEKIEVITHRRALTNNPRCHEDFYTYTTPRTEKQQGKEMSLETEEKMNSINSAMKIGIASHGPVSAQAESDYKQFEGADPCTHPQCECKGAICIKRYENERLQRYIAQLESDNKLLREEIERLKAKVIVTIEEIPGKIDV